MLKVWQLLSFFKRGTFHFFCAVVSLNEKKTKWWESSPFGLWKTFGLVLRLRLCFFFLSFPSTTNCFFFVYFHFFWQKRNFCSQNPFFSSSTIFSPKKKTAGRTKRENVTVSESSFGSTRKNSFFGTKRKVLSVSKKSQSLFSWDVCNQVAPRPWPHEFLEKIQGNSKCSTVRKCVQVRWTKIVRSIFCVRFSQFFF